jgi:hypothetical protein
MNLSKSLMVLAFLCLWTRPAFASEDVACKTQKANGKRVVYSCVLPVKAKEQPLHFKAFFSGSHDDTELSIYLTLNALPVKCDKGSKTWLNGVDGDVSLDCLFKVSGTAGTKKTLNVTVDYYHAQLTAVKLSAP